MQSIDDLKSNIEAAVLNTDAGIKADPSLRAKADELLSALEGQGGVSEPSQSELLDGIWRVRYSTAPPPSNGQLGPFIGRAFQNVDLRAGTYRNLLLVGEGDGWLRAQLDADWKVVDSRRWTVFFRSLEIAVFGYTLFRKEWENNTRAWKMTYLDSDTRVVRAGRTRDTEDDVVFYMRRQQDLS